MMRLDGQLISRTGFALLFLCSTSMTAHAQAGTCSVRSKIVGGEFARITAWPGIAAMRLHSKAKSISSYTCGGTAIAQNWVLTAAHCVHKFIDGPSSQIEDDNGSVFPAKLQVVMRNDRLTDAKDADVFDVDKVVIHPKYLADILNARANPNPETALALEQDLPITKGNDIALLRLARNFRGRTARLSLSPRTDPSDRRRQKVRVAGFGRTHNNIFQQATKKYTSTNRPGYFFAGSNRLKQATLLSTSTAKCSRFYSKVNPRPEIGDLQICAGLEQGGEDSCNGDSGGPLVSYDVEGCPYQIGVVSWGKNRCGVGESYSVYTRVSAHARWIQDVVGELPSVPANAVAASSDRISLADSLDAIGQLQDLLGSATGKVTLRISENGRQRIRLGEKLVFRATSSISGRLILIDINANGEVLLIFPNKYVRGDEIGKISAGDTISVPGAGYGFTAFQAVEPVGKSRMIALIVPEDFDLSRVGASPSIRTKGMVPINEPTNYLARFIRQIERFFIGSRSSGNDQQAKWAYSVTEYEIVN